MRCAVSGANGFIGKALCLHLEMLGYEVVPIIRAKSNLGGDLGNFLSKDLRDFLVGCDSVVHLAGYSQIPFGGISGRVLRQANVDLTLTLAKLSVEMGVGRFVYMSSAKVNGENTFERAPFTPADIPKPSGDYANSKAEAEEGLRQISSQSGLNVVIIRPPAVYGPGVKGNFLNLIKLATSEFPLPLGGITAQRALIAIDNLVDFTALCANPELSENAVGETFLVSDGLDLSLRSILELIATAYGKNLHLFSCPLGVLKFIGFVTGKSKLLSRLTHPLCLDISKVADRLGWHPVTTPWLQIRKMAEYEKMDCNA